MTAGIARIRVATSIETAAGIRRVVFDKTGTLTRGKMAVVATVTNRETASSERDLLCLAAAVEQYSEHPVARAIIAACPSPPGPAAEFQLSRGAGASAVVSRHAGRRVRVGSLAYLGGSAATALLAQASTRAAGGETLAWIGWDDEIAGFITLRDEPNPTARDALRQLTDDGIRVVDLSIAMGSGTDVAGETSDLVLLRLDLTLVPWFIQLSGRTRRIIRENLGWAFAYNLFLVPLAAFGVVSPVIAAMSMSASSLLIVVNSLRLHR